jgi:hypothetical protein
MSIFKKIFLKKKEQSPQIEVGKSKVQKVSSSRIGELGEYKINIQLDQLPKDMKHLHDLMLVNPKASSGYSQIDHILITPWTIFVIETKNYSGSIRGSRKDTTWTVNGKFKMMNPFRQNFGHIEAIKKVIPYAEKASFVSMISFTKRATFRIDQELRHIQSNELCVYDIELTEFVNRKINVLKLMNKEPLLTVNEVEEIHALLTKANILDPEIRKMHIENSKPIVAKCETCEKTVSDKVKSFCMSSKKFNGKIYCFEHQKDVL